MIKRVAESRLKKLASTFRSVAVVGPRQSGKTTLCRTVFPKKPYVSLENPDMAEFAKSDTRAFLAQFKDGAILDEVQRVPQIFSYLQQVLDETKKRGLFILTGSNNFLLQENITQTLAGRIGYQQLLPLSLQELKLADKLKKDVNWHLVHGGYPEVLAKKIKPTEWYPAYVQTYVERDVRQLKSIGNLTAFTKLVRLCAGRTGQLLNMTSLAVDCGLDQKTVAAWLAVLQSSFIVYLLRPYHKNFNKRLVKTPKLYFYDTGLACWLLGITQPNELLAHQAKGALFENMVVIEMLKQRMNKGLADNLYFWRDKTGHEIDLLVDDKKPIAYELKSGQTLSPEFYKGLDFFQTLEPNAATKLIWGGTHQFLKNSGTEILPWDAFF